MRKRAGRRRRRSSDLGVVASRQSGADAIKERRRDEGEWRGDKSIVAMLKGAPFDLAAVQKALKTYDNAAEKMPALFPPDSKTATPTPCRRSGPTPRTSTPALRNSEPTPRRLETTSRTRPASRRHPNVLQELPAVATRSIAPRTIDFAPGR